jgi:hypothetical protein
MMILNELTHHRDSHPSRTMPSRLSALKMTVPCETQKSPLDRLRVISTHNSNPSISLILLVPSMLQDSE